MKSMVNNPSTNPCQSHFFLNLLIPLAVASLSCCFSESVFLSRHFCIRSVLDIAALLGIKWSTFPSSFFFIFHFSFTIFCSCAFCSAVLSLEGGSPATKLSICSCNSTNLRCSAVSWDWFSDCDTCVASFLSFRFLFSSGSSLQNHLLILLTSSHHFWARLMCEWFEKIMLRTKSDHCYTWLIDRQIKSDII